MEYKPSVQTRKGPNRVLNAVLFDNTGYLNLTAWGDRADSINATLTTNKLYEIYNAALTPANKFQNLGALSASVDTERLNEGLAKKYAKSLADLSDSDDSTNGRHLWN